MRLWEKVTRFAGSALLVFGIGAQAQMIDNTQAQNTAKAGINKSLQDEIGGELAFQFPLIVTRDGFIVDGYGRWELAQAARPVDTAG
ncbi:MAG TPA: hypothetical protein VE957_09845 [Terriglobales bacterium]|nr:hypothetical protein [Terriglobales bacterium]